MAVITKADVKFGGFTSTLLTILEALVWIDTYPVYGQPKYLMITSGSEGTHMKGSKHYIFEAVDVRSNNMVSNTKKEFMYKLSTRLNPNEFTILLESKGTPNEHFHIQLRKNA